ncbi:MAG: S41 family peptidase [Bacteroidia bacterium]
MLAVFLVFAGLFPFFARAQNGSPLTKKYAPKALIEDAVIVQNAVLQMHPVLGIYKPRAYYEQLFSALIAGLKDSLTEKEFRVRLKLLFDELHCGHSEVLYSKNYIKAIRPMQVNFLPYYFIPLNGKVYTAIPLNSKRDSLLKPATEILKFNSIAVDSITDYIKRFITGDGFITSGKNLYLRNGFSFSYPSLFGRPDSVQIEYRYHSDVKTAWLHSVKLRDLDYLPIWPRADSTLKKYTRADISAGAIADCRSAYLLRIRSFKSFYYKRVYRRLFRQLEKNRTENLVIDLRNNGGGNLSNSYRLLRYLMDTVETITLKTHVKNFPLRRYTYGNGSFRFTKWVLNIVGTKKVNGDTTWYTQTIKPLKKHHFNKHIYVLINGGTFSASCIVAAYLKHTGRATFIGTETSGAQEGCNAGVTTYYKLPNTQIKIRVPAFRLIHDVYPANSGRGILPDYEVPYKIEDLLRRKDLEMIKVKAILH